MPKSLSGSQSWLSKLDALGAVAAFLCAAHCALLPIALVVLPMAGFDYLAGHAFEQGFVLFALSFAALVIGSGYCPHARHRTFMLYLLAAIGLLYGAFVLDHGWLHGLSMACGGTALGTAHALNRLSVRRHGCARNLWRALWQSLGSEKYAAAERISSLENPLGG